jgi:VRR-NUC domain
LTRKTPRSECTHPTVDCLNPHEIIHKYECASCGGITMCACEERFARKHLPHQLSTGTRLATRERVPVDLGFQPAACRPCRGLPEPATPAAAIHGRTSKVRRYYWREILIESSTRFETWVERNGTAFKPLLHRAKEYRDEYERIEGEVVDEIRAQHEVAPKYTYREKSQEEVLREACVETMALKARYAASPTKGKTIDIGSEVIAVEEFVRRHFEGTGLTVLRAESIPFHVIFATLMYPVVCDPDDERGRFATFGDRDAFDRREKGPTTTAWLPEDFGTPGYGRRRAIEIAERLREMPKYGTTVVEEFDWLVNMSEPLRQYLWAHRREDILRASEILSVLSLTQVRTILGYLAEDYWRHYLGWPDLLVTGSIGFFFVEVKGSADKLSEDQKSWVAGNAKTLHLPFKLVKVHRDKGDK